MPDLPICRRLSELAQFNCQRNWTNGLYAYQAAETIEQLFEAADALIEAMYLHDMPPRVLNAMNVLENVLDKARGEA